MSDLIQIVFESYVLGAIISLIIYMFLDYEKAIKNKLVLGIMYVVCVLFFLIIVAESTYEPIS